MAIQHHRRARAWPALTEWFEDFPFLHLGADQHMIRVEEYQEDGTYTVKAELPGIDPHEDVEITVDHGFLTVHAERSEEKKEGKRSEFRYGAFTRSVQLPPGVRVDDIKATYDKGVLTVTAPTGTPEGQAKRIQVTGGSEHRPGPATDRRPTGT